MQYGQRGYQRPNKALCLPKRVRCLLQQLLQLRHVRFLEYHRLACSLWMLCTLHFYDGAEIQTDASPTAKYDDAKSRTDERLTTNCPAENSRYHVVNWVLRRASCNWWQRSSAVHGSSSATWGHQATSGQQPTYDTSPSDAEYWSKRDAYGEFDAHDRRYSYICPKRIAETSQLYSCKWVSTNFSAQSPTYNWRGQLTKLKHYLENCLRYLIIILNI